MASHLRKQKRLTIASSRTLAKPKAQPDRYAFRRLMASNLGDQTLIVVPMGTGTPTLPLPQLLENLPMLHRILEEVLRDWHRAVEPYEARLVAKTEPANY